MTPQISRDAERTLSIVIVNWNTGDMLGQSLASIAGAPLPAGFRLASVVVVDNASSDGSADTVHAHGLPLRLVPNDVNRGFAVACNQGAAACTSDYVLFLNPDTRLFESSLRVPLAYLDDAANAHVGIVGIQLFDDHGQVARTCARFPMPRHFLAQAFGLDKVLPTLGHHMAEWDHAQTREVDQVIGAFFLTRRGLFDRLGGFDERFFVYFEEVDFALRARRQGWRSMYLANASAYHMAGGSSRKVKARRLFYSLRSRLQFAAKHFSRPRRALIWIVSLALEPATRLVHLVARGRMAETRDVFEAWRLLLADRGGNRRRVP